MYAKEEKAIAGRVFPDGSFGYSFRKLKPVSSLVSRHCDTSDPRALESALLRLWTIASLVWASSLVGGLPMLFLLAERILPSTRDHLGLSGAINFRKKPRAPRGARGISGRQRCRVRSAAVLLELRFGKRNLSFATLTLPALQGEDRKIAQQAWAKACDRFFEELKRFLARRGFPLLYVGCYEIQEKRSSREGWAVPHLHFIFVGRKGKEWIVTPQELRHLWQRVWQNRLFRRYCWTACENLQRIRKSAAAYLAKYLSKGSQALSSDSESEGAWHPSTWVVANRLMKRWIGRSSISVRMIWPLVMDLKSLRDNFTRSGMRPIRRVPSGADCEIVVGVAGWINYADWNKFRARFFPESFVPPVGVP